MGVLERFGGQTAALVYAKGSRTIYREDQNVFVLAMMLAAMKWVSFKTKKALNYPVIRKIQGFERIPGDVLLSHIVSHAVPSALKSLTSVFGMGTGVTSLLSSPEKWITMYDNLGNDLMYFNVPANCANYFVAKPHDQLVPVS